MASAIELYRQAYEADYSRGDGQYAEELYRRIVEEFPYSEEKEYALVHLERMEKLRADPNNPALQPSRGGGGGLAVFNFAVLLLVAVAVGFLAYFLWQQQARHEHNDLVLQGMLCERSGEYEAANLKYKQALAVAPNRQGLAHRLLAELYLKQNQVKLAEIESGLWQLAIPQDPSLAVFRQKLAAKTGADSSD